MRRVCDILNYNARGMSFGQENFASQGRSAADDGKESALFPAGIRLYHKRAIKSIDKADFTAALKNLRKAVEMEPDNLTYKMDLADTYARMGPL